MDHLKHTFGAAGLAILLGGCGLSDDPHPDYRNIMQDGSATPTVTDNGKEVKTGWEIKLELDRVFSNAYHGSLVLNKFERTDNGVRHSAPVTLDGLASNVLGARTHMLDRDAFLKVHMNAGFNSGETVSFTLARGGNSVRHSFEKAVVFAQKLNDAHLAYAPITGMASINLGEATTTPANSNSFIAAAINVMGLQMPEGALDLGMPGVNVSIRDNVAYQNSGDNDTFPENDQDRAVPFGARFIQASLINHYYYYIHIIDASISGNSTCETPPPADLMDKAQWMKKCPDHPKTRDISIAVEFSGYGPDALEGDDVFECATRRNWVEDWYDGQELIAHFTAALPGPYKQAFVKQRQMELDVLKAKADDLCQGIEDKLEGVEYTFDIKRNELEENSPGPVTSPPSPIAGITTPVFTGGHSINACVSKICANENSQSTVVTPAGQAARSRAVGGKQTIEFKAR